MDYVFITRPILFFPGWTTMLLGFLVVSPHIAPFSCNQPSSEILMAMLSFAFAMGGSFIFNQIADKSSDEINQKCFFIGRGMVSVKAARFEAILLIVLSLILATRINYLFVLGILIFNVLTAYLYNYPPFTFKDKAVPGFLGNVIMGWLAFYLGAVLKTVDFEILVIHALPYVLLNSALYIFTTLPDAEGDRDTGKKTVGVVLSFRSNILLALFLFFTGWAISYFLKDNTAMLIYVLSLYSFIRLLINTTMENVIKTTKWTIFIYSLVVAGFFPWYVVIGMAGFFITRSYYKNRFHLDYPSFKGE